MNLPIPELSLVLLVGASGAGKSTFARKHFRPTEVLSSDFFRGLVRDDETDQAATVDAFESLQFVAGKRLAAGRLTVVDATNVQREARRPLVALARRHHVLPVAIVFDLPEKLCVERTRGRPDRLFGGRVIGAQCRDLRRSLPSLREEGLRAVHVLTSPEGVEAAVVVREKLYPDRRSEHGPFDLIGDVHGCCDELEELLRRLGYAVRETPAGGPVWAHPQGRKAVFVGDLVDRGPRVLDTLALVRHMVAAGTALCVPGNHDAKLQRKLRGRDVQVTHGLERTLAEIDALPAATRAAAANEIADFLDSLISHYVLDDGRLVVAHAGLKAEMHGRASREVRDFALYGETTGESDEFGLPVRQNWAADYRGAAMVVYGHTPVAEAEWLNRTINLDTGCVFGGKLTALRYPERDLVAVPAARVYYASARAFRAGPDALPGLTAQQRQDELLDLEDVLGKRVIATRMAGNVTIPEEHAAAALEVMSRFAVNPKWLIHLPPTMSPADTARDGELLEHPAEAFAYYRHEGVERVVCEEKHMGSRAVAIVCRDEEAARRRFGVVGEGAGACVTRTGRAFFEDPALAAGFLDALRTALERAGFWERFSTDWFCLDGEILPWSAKARELLRRQYAAAGAAARAGLAEAVEALERATARQPDCAPLLERFRARSECAEQFVEAYRRYCWPVGSLADLRFAPFHLLASRGKLHFDRDHMWHMEQLHALCDAGGGFLLSTTYRIVELNDARSEAAGSEWWEYLTSRGGEGMVVKPFEFLAHGRRGWAQPGVKCRGREYLRLIYGPDYTLTEHLSRLRTRAVGAKRSLALREFALGMEGLERFVRGEPLRRVHECVFGVLALESEAVDPRL